MKVPSFLFPLVLLLLCASSAGADTCFVCREPLQGQVYLLSGPYSVRKEPVCNQCVQLPTHCASCRLPLKSNYTTLPDGRVLCAFDNSHAIFSMADAHQIFHETKRAVMRMFAGVGAPPDENIKLFLIDQKEMQQVSKIKTAPQELMRHMGLTKSKIRQGAEPEHEIYLLNGLRRSRFQAVCAHEYAHAWLNQNLSQTRNLSTDTVEGFCELVAYNLMLELNDPHEPRIILTNDYSKGQILAMVQAQQQYRFYALLEWMKQGTASSIDPANPACILEMNGKAGGKWDGWLPQSRTVAPQRLILKGISGQPDKRFALVNNQTLAKGDTAKVRIGAGNVTVQCIEVKEQSVVLQIAGESAPTELYIETRSQ